MEDINRIKVVLAEKKRERVAELASQLYVMVCQEYKNAHTAQIYELPETESIDMAAEPFECYNWNRLDQDIIDLFGGNKTILVGCFKNKKHLTWIKGNAIYNIRLGNRAGSIDEDKECINNASILVLYSTRKKSDVSVFRITSHCVMTETEMKAKGYPNKKVGKRYMTFNIEEEPSMVELIKNHNLVGKLIESYPEHVSRAPVFLEP